MRGVSGSGVGLVDGRPTALRSACRPRRTCRKRGSCSRNQERAPRLLHGLRAAVAQLPHVLTMDADGQHAVGTSRHSSYVGEQPDALVLGTPIFDATAPRLRVVGRRISNWWANLETLWEGIGDSLFGMRVYPAAALLQVMESQRWMRRFDFDVEAAVRLVWGGARPVNLPAPVRYFRPEEGGVSHFKYVRDNALLSWMHLRLFSASCCACRCCWHEAGVSLHGAGTLGNAMQASRCREHNRRIDEVTPHALVHEYALGSGSGPDYDFEMPNRCSRIVPMLYGRLRPCTLR